MSTQNQWSSIKALGSSPLDLSWAPTEDQDRIRAYFKYEDLYWNSNSQYSLRVVDNETPLYIPNPRIIVDTTAYYLLKGLQITTTSTNKEEKKALEDFLKRESFLSRFHNAKLAGVAKGDFVFHMTANPNKPEGRRISLTSVPPSSVFPIWDEEDPGSNSMIGCHLAEPFILPLEEDPEQRVRLRRLTYRKVIVGSKTRIEREEVILELENAWDNTGKAKVVKTILPKALLDEGIETIPIYWFKNRDWDGDAYGSSELRGIESIAQVVSQGSTDVNVGLSITGLGVYATDGGRPVDANGADTEWEIAPGRVMEVPSGSYFRKVDGVTNISPATDQIKYLEMKMNDAAGLSEVALGKVEPNIASSGIALAIHFIPTLAKIETRDQQGIDILTQMFFDWKTWYRIFEGKTLQGDIIPVIGDKLPIDKTAKLNELNNMFDRQVISRKYYRSEMEKLGYTFPDNIEADILKDLELKAKLATQSQNTSAPDDEENSADDEQSTLPEDNNGSNNRRRPNESSGTEA